MMLSLSLLIFLFFTLACSTAPVNSSNSPAAQSDITVTWLGGSNCSLEFLGRKMRCALGKNGATFDKKEGDGKTPLGNFPLRRAFYRADKTTTACYNIAPYLSCEATQTTFGWVDEPTDAMYNQFVLLPYRNDTVSHENLYLTTDSPVYDLLAVVGYNDAPVAVPFKGSAIFFHVASEGYGATAGCVSLQLADLVFVLTQATARTRFIVTDGTQQH